MPKFSTLAERVQWLSDLAEIEQLHHRYAHYLHLAEPQLIISLFADRPEVEIEIANKGIWVGADAPTRVFSKNRAQRAMPGALNLHLGTNPVIDIEPDRSRARASWLSPGISTFRWSDEPIAAWNWGRYHTEYVIEDDAWKMLVMRYRQIFFTPYDKGWVEASLDTEFDGVRDGPAPDRESSPTFHRPYDRDTAQVFGPLPPGTPREFAVDDEWTHRE